MMLSLEYRTLFIDGEMADKCQVVAAVCKSLAEGDLLAASATLQCNYRLAPEKPTVRKYGPLELTRVFVRDGFVDRYTGKRLTFPRFLRVISGILPTEFLDHRNWKADVTHPAYYERAATADHWKPASRSGPNDDSNLMSFTPAKWVSITPALTANSKLR